MRVSGWPECFGYLDHLGFALFAKEIGQETDLRFLLCRKMLEFLRIAAAGRGLLNSTFRYSWSSVGIVIGSPVSCRRILMQLGFPLC